MSDGQRRDATVRLVAEAPFGWVVKLRYADDERLWGIWEDRRGPIWGRFASVPSNTPFNNFAIYDNYWDALQDFLERKARYAESSASR